MSQVKQENNEFLSRIATYFTERGELFDPTGNSPEVIFYNLKMFWLNRPDKLNESDYPLYIWLTNTVFDSELKSKLPDNYKPSFHNESIFEEDVSFSDMKNTFMLKLNCEVKKKEYQTKTTWRDKLKLWK